jgi:hypothetical protein
MAEARRSGDRDNLMRALAGLSSLMAKGRGGVWLGRRLFEAAQRVAPSAADDPVPLAMARHHLLACEGRLDDLASHLGTVRPLVERNGDAHSAWTTLDTDVQGARRYQLADWSSLVLGLWADTADFATIPAPLWTVATRACRPFPVFRLRVALARHDTLLRSGRTRAAGRILRKALPIADQVGGMLAATTHLRAAGACGGLLVPAGKAHIDAALAFATDATPGTPLQQALARPANQPVVDLPAALPWARAARALGLGAVWAEADARSSDSGASGAQRLRALRRTAPSGLRLHSSLRGRG